MSINGIILSLNDSNDLFFIKCEKDKSFINYIKKKDNIELKTNISSNVAISSAITSKARIRLYNAQQSVIKNGGRMLYSDTDSIIAAYKKNVINETHGEIFWDDKNKETIIKDAVFVGPKTYGILYNNGKTVVKIKGFYQNSIDFIELKNKFYSNLENITVDNFEYLSKKDFLLKRENIKKIIIVHGLTDITIEKIKLCKPLLYVISNALVIGLTATGTGIRNIAEVLLPAATELTIKLASLAGQGLAMGASLAGQGLAMGASMARDRFSRGANFLLSRQLEEPQIRARSPSPSRQMYAYAGEVVLPAVEFTRGVLSGLYRVLSQIFGSISTILSPCFGAAATSLRGVASRGVEQLCSLLTPEQAVGAAVDQVVQEGPDLECSICMDNAIQGAVVTSCGHRFHQSCIQEWFRQSRNRSCPYCRTSVTELTQPQYGGLKKYRSKTRTKSKSKSRRYVSKPHKSRKARKRVRYASSRRK